MFDPVLCERFDDVDQDTQPATNPAPACAKGYECGPWLRTGDNATYHDKATGYCPWCQLAEGIEDIRTRLVGLPDDSPAWDALGLLEHNLDRLAGQLEEQWTIARAVRGGK